MNSSLHTVNASMIISWLVIAGLFLLVIFQYREVTRYRRRFNRLLGERLGLGGEGRAPHSTQSWFVGELMLPVILLDTAKARVLSISPGAREWLAGLGVCRPETFIERQLADNDGENLSFRELKEQLSLRHRQSVSFIDQVELVDDVGRTRRLAINVTSLPLACTRGDQLLVFVSGVMSETGDDTAFQKFYQLIGATLTQPSLPLALNSILSALAKTTSQPVSLSVSIYRPETDSLELTTRRDLPDALTDPLKTAAAGYGHGVHATAAILDRPVLQDLRKPNDSVPRALAAKMMAAGVTFWASWPVCGLNGQLLGTLDVYGNRPGVIDRLSGRVPLAIHLAAATLERHHAAREVQARVQSLERQALFDHLTGLYSRGKTEEAMRQAIAHAQRYKTPLALAMFDIDLFKRINDTWGHDMGDEVLRSLANRVRQTVRGADVVGRWGGEEFLLLLPETRLEDAMLVAENIRKKAEDCNYSPVPVVTVSLGVAGYQLGDTPETLVKKADEALYAAKEAGRNRVVAHTGSGYREAAS